MTQGDPVGVALLENDCKLGIFRASIGGLVPVAPWSVNVYPRKSKSGFVWLVWDQNARDDQGLNKIKAGGYCVATDERHAILEAVTKMLDIHFDEGAGTTG